MSARSVLTDSGAQLKRATCLAKRRYPPEGPDKVTAPGDNSWMTKQTSLYKRNRYPPDIIQYPVWLYYRFNLSHRDIENLLAERGIAVSRESIRLWCNKFGPRYARRLKRRHQGYEDTLSSMKSL